MEVCAWREEIRSEILEATKGLIIELSGISGGVRDTKGNMEIDHLSRV